jgi:hypothetical protein
MTPRRGTAAFAAVAAAVAVAVTGCGSDGVSYAIDDCTPRTDGRSVARVWDEVLLDAIRRDYPAPTVHARNLFHVSAAMWDAWAAYDPRADGYVVTEKHEADDPQAAREAAISYAAYRTLLFRYAYAQGLEETFAELTRTMESLCYRVGFARTDGDSPAAVGNRIARAVIDRGLEDGALEREHYTDTEYAPVNEPLVVAEPEIVMHDPLLWQPLALDEVIAQNGLVVPGQVQHYVGPHWGAVDAFALPESAEEIPFDPGPPFAAGGARTVAFKQAAIEVLRRSTQLDRDDPTTIDIGPGALGNNPLGTNDGHGHETNPATGQPYAPNRVLLADFGRVIAEFWADGPDSETPPGHWNVLANRVSDAPQLRSRIGAAPADRLAWDVRLYFALNGALHDAAVAAWGAKRAYQTARPISMIRHLGFMGQSSDRTAPSYDPEGLPLVPGLVELVTPESSAPGGRHRALRGHVGAVAVRGWRGPEGTPDGGVGWMLATAWVPYQRETFVTPAFPGYVSGHSTFSRAAAEVLTAATGSRFFPGGMLTHDAPAGSLDFEPGPTRDVVLQWATYFDAADQSGISRIFGGIHPSVDDLAGRRIGSVCGKAAWKLAQRYVDGSARS